jgi:LacI family transcriptional regulator
MAIGAMRAISDAGLSVPGDIAVVGFDDIEAASIVRPSLTTIRQDRNGLARAAIGMVGDAALREHVEPVGLVVRDSA